MSARTIGGPTIMSNVLSLGVPLTQVVAMATSNAARAFPKATVLGGKLVSGANAPQ